MRLCAPGVTRNVLIAAVLASVVAGCGTFGPIDLDGPSPAPKPAPVATAAPAPVSGQPKRPARPPVPRPKPEAAAPSVAEAAGPVVVAGLSPDETRALLGPPVRETDTAPTRIWRYEAEGCAVDVFFVFEVSRNAFKALHAEPATDPAPAQDPSGQAGGAKAGTNDPDLCLRKVRDAATRRS